MAPKKYKKSKQAKGTASATTDVENAMRDRVNKYDALLNEAREELGARSRTDGSIFKKEEILKVLKDPEVQEHMAKVGMGELADYEKLQDRAKLETMFKMMTIGSSPAEVYSDGDQSPLRGADAQVLQFQWADGMDYNPTNEHMTDWMRNLYKGDYSLTMRLLGKLSESQASKLLEKRESLLNVSAVFHVINGARSLNGDNPLFASMRAKIENKKGHIKILSKLLEMGADLKAKDMAGYTPLHHCLTCYRNDTTLAMAEMLLKAGADPDLQNRFGCSPIFECITAADEEAIKLLLKYGASTEVKEYGEGSTPFKMANSFPKVSKLFREAGMHKAKKMRAEQKAAAGGSFRLCGGSCGAEGTKRCTGCYMVLYCGAACQRSSWPGHSATCKTSQAQYKPVDLVLTCATADQVGTTLNYKTQKVYSQKYTGQPNKKHFVIKIQVPIQDGFGYRETTNDDFMIYNEDRSIMGFMKREGHEDVYDSLNMDIRNRGVHGLKGFYYAIFKDTKKEKGRVSTMQIKINSEVMLPMESW